MTTAAEIAEFMTARVVSGHVLDQEVAVSMIMEQFGREWTYINDNGNMAIHRSVLKAFNSLTADTIVWERGARIWRLRQPYDQPGRQQS